MRMGAVLAALLVLGGCSSGGDSASLDPQVCVSARLLAETRRPAQDSASTDPTALQAELQRLHGFPTEGFPDLGALVSLYDGASDAMHSARQTDGAEPGDDRRALIAYVDKHRDDYERLHDRVSRRIESECYMSFELSLLRLAGASADYLTPGTIEDQLDALACRGTDELAIYRLPPATRSGTEGFDLVAEVEAECKSATVVGRLDLPGDAPHAECSELFLVEVGEREEVRGWASLGRACSNLGFPVCEVIGSAAIDDGADATRAALGAFPVADLAPLSRSGDADLTLVSRRLNRSGEPCRPGSIGGGGLGALDLKNAGTAATPVVIEIRTDEGVEVLTLVRGLEPGETVALPWDSPEMEVDPSDKIRESDESNNKARASEDPLYVCQ